VLNPDLKEQAMRNRSTATPRQVAYLRSLALQTGTTFSPPRTREDASGEIDRLKALKASRGRYVEARRATDSAEQPYATAVDSSEVSGFGSQARWRTSPPAAASAVPRENAVGKLTELARYQAGGQQRVLCGQRIDGCVRITDRPAAGSGRSYLVDRELERDGYSALKALVADYLEQAQELGEIPMASSVLADQLQSVKSNS
jgi:hypothetical protein